MFNTNWWNRVRYTVWAPIYSPVLVIMRRWRKKAIRRADLRPGERVLLVGAGTGLDLDFIGPGPQLTAIDLVPAMVRRLRRRARKRGLQVDARVMDGQALEFPDGSFDVVLLYLIIAVIPDPARCVREAARVLKPGGRAVIFDKFVPDGRKPPLAWRLINPIMRILASDITRQLGPLLEGTGLRIEHEEAGLHGYLRIVVVRKERQGTGTRDQAPGDVNGFHHQ